MRNLIWILALSVLVLGCDQGQKMLEPVTRDILTQEPVSEESLPPTEEVEIESFPGFFESIDAFTSAQAALESKQFQEFVEYAREYNEEWCDKNERAAGEDIGGINVFEFTTEQAADAFLTQAPALYPNDVKPDFGPKRIATEAIPSWGIFLSPRCQ